MLADDVVLVVLDVAHTDEPGLGMAAHDLAVEVEARRGLAHEHAVLLEAEEVFLRLGIHAVVVVIHLVRQVYLRAVHVEEVDGVACAEGLGFGAVDDIVGDGGDLGGLVRCRNEALERTEAHGTGGGVDWRAFTDGEECPGRKRAGI